VIGEIRLALTIENLSRDAGIEVSMLLVHQRRSIEMGYPFLLNAGMAWHTGIPRTAIVF
jgi:hypothetical protein